MMISKKINQNVTRILGKLLFLTLIFFTCLYINYPPLQGQESEVIDSGDLIVLGARLEINPAQQTVPINTRTIVNTVFSVGDAQLLEGMIVKGILRGPGLANPIALTTLPNHPFSIPGLPTKGTYTLENIQLEKDGKKLLTAEPEQVVIEAMDIIITKVESRPLTLEEIREKGIVISEENFQVYNFSVGFIVNTQEVKYDFPIVYTANNEVYIPGPSTSSGFGIPNFPGGREPLPISFDLPEIEIPGSDVEQEEAGHPVSGLVIFNNDIAFLNQFFSVMFIVSNQAPEQSSLLLKDITATINYPEGLREAETNPPRLAGAPMKVLCPGPDGKIGTSDDLNIIMATFSGMAEFLAEGLEEGTHIVDIEFNGTLSGLLTGDTPFTGTASGAVIVRNPEFGITFAHPSVIRKGEEYDIFVTMTNTSPVTANLMSLTMPTTRLVGTILLSEETLSWETIAPGESITGTFHMRSTETGRIRASAFEADGHVSGKFVLTAGVGEKGIPLSPDTLVLPEWAYYLPFDLINPTMLLLGEAYSIATTPPGGLPEGLPFVSREIITNRVMELAEAGQRVCYSVLKYLTDQAEHPLDILHRLAYETDEPADPQQRQHYLDAVLSSLYVMVLDWQGNRLPDLPFDTLRRLTSKGISLADSVAGLFNHGLLTSSPAQFQHSFTETCSYKPPFVSVLLSFGGGSRSACLRITDFYLNRLSNENGSDLIRNIPYGELYLMEGPGQSPVDFALIGHPDENGYTVQITGTAEGSADLSLIIPDTSGGFRQVLFPGISCQPGSMASITVKNTDTGFSLSLDNDGDGLEDSLASGSITAIQVPSLQLMGAVQECSADEAGHATALLFNRPLDPETAKEKSNYSVTDKAVYASFLQTSGRVILIGTDNPVSPFVESRIQVENLKDTSGGSLSVSPVEIPVIATIRTPGGIVFGKILSADGEPIPKARVQLLERNGSKRTLSFDISDTNGDFQFDFVRILPDPFTIEVQDVTSKKIERVSSRLMSNGQRLQIDIIMRARGSVRGRVLDTQGNSLAGVSVTARSENTGIWESYGAKSNEQGEYVIEGIPLGLVNLSAGHGSNYGSASTGITASGQIQIVDITLVGIKTASVSGRVFYNDGVTPASDAYVNFYGSYQYATSVRTDEAGRFQFLSVPVGDFRIKAYNPLTGKEGGYISGVLVEDEEFNTTIIFRGTGRIYGKVVSYDNIPQPNVFVYIDGTSFYMDTDSSGNFNFQDVPVGSYHVRAVHRTSGAKTYGSVNLIAESQEAYVPLTFANTTPGSITGTVYDVDGQTLSNIDVYLVDGNYIARGVATTSPNGFFTFQDLAVGNYILISARSESAGVSRTTIQSPGHQAQCDVRYLGKGKVNIEVLAPSQETGEMTGVMADVTFYRTVFEMEEGSFIGFRSIEEQYLTDENGHLTIDKVYMGPIQVQAWSDFYPRGDHYQGSIDSHGQEVNVQLEMKPSGKIQGHVVSYDGETRVAGVSLEFVCGRINYTSYSESETTGEQGYFEFNLVPPGNFLIKAEDPSSGLKGICYGTMGQDGGLVEVTLRLLGKGQVQGIVKNQSEELLANVSVTVKNTGYPHGEFKTATDPYGAFSVSGVWEGPFSVSAFHTGLQIGGRTEGEIPANGTQANVEVILEAVGTVKGRVMSPEGVSEMTDAQVVLYHSKFNYQPVGYFYVSQEGGYTFESIPEGQYYLEAVHPGSGRKGKKYGLVESEGQVVITNVYLEGRGTVTGTFYDGSGVTPVPFAGIKLKSKGTYPFTLESTTDGEGNFTFPQVAKGEFDLEATDPGNGLTGKAGGQVEYEGETVYIDVMAHGWGRVKGRIYDANGILDSSGARVVVNQGGKAYQAYADESTGEYTISFVPIGSFTITAYQRPNERDYGTGTGTVRYHGQEVEVDITFRGLGRVSGRVLDGSGNSVSGVGVTLTSGKERFPSSSQGEGQYLFENIRMGPFSLEAVQGALSASGSGELTSNGQEVSIDLILESAGSVSGRVLNPDGTTPAENAYITLKSSNTTRYYNTGGTGEFEFKAVKVGDFTLNVSGYNQEGKARVLGRIDHDGEIVGVGDLVLDNVVPQVTAITFASAGENPVDGSAGVPLTTSIKIHFSEEMAASSLNDSSIYLSSLNGRVIGTMEIQPEGKSVIFTPPLLSSFVLYTLHVTTAVEDISGNMLGATVSASFTTSDVQPPAVSGINPAHNAVGVPIDAVITVTFNEPVDAGAFTNQNLVVTKGGAGVEGNISFSGGNLVVIFTPELPLESDSGYHLTVQGARDFSGNIQTLVFSSDFSTIDTIAPTVQLIPPAQGTAVVEGSSVSIEADTGSAGDIAVVHFFINGETMYSDTQPVYRFNFTAPLISQAGSSILVEAMAVDHAGNQSAKANLTLSLQPDTSPQITLTGPSSPAVFPGSTFNCQVTATDDVGLSQVIVTALGGTLNYNNTRSVADNSPTFSKSYTIAVPSDIQPGTNITLHAHATDIRGNLANAVDISLYIPQDEQDPTVTITSPAEASRFKHNEEIQIAAAASDDVGLKEIRIYLDDQLLATHTREPYTASYTVPPLEQEKQSEVKVEAEDLVGKVSQDTVHIIQEQLVDLTAPQVNLLTPSSGTLVYAGENLKIKGEATDDEGVDHVDIFVDDQIQQTFTQSPYEMIYTIPSGAEPGSTITIKVVATDVDNKTGTEQSVLSVVTGTFLPAGTNIESSNPGYDNQTIIINDGTVTIDGEHRFLNVLVKESGHLAHTGCDTIVDYNLGMNVTGKVVVGPDAKIDVSGRGYMGARQTVNGLTNSTDYGLTVGNQPGSHYQSGGSHGGYGGQYQSYLVTGVYGSPYDPSQCGSGGGGHSSYKGGNGGGSIRLQASELIIDGLVAANGVKSDHSAGGGAGGSLYFNITGLTGSGQIQVYGGSSWQGTGGGGGRIAIYYTSSGKFDFNSISAWGGIGNLGQYADRNGGPGSIYLEKSGQDGELLVRRHPDYDCSKGSSLDTPAPGTITAIEEGKLTDEYASFLPGSLAGMLLQPNINNPRTFVITSNNETEISVEYQVGNGLTHYAQEGDRYQVKHRGAIVVENSNVQIKGNASIPNLLLDNSTLVVDGTLSAGQLTLQSGSVITHSPTLVGTTYTLNIEADDLEIGEGCSIDVTGRGYPGAFEKDNIAGATGVTYPNTLENGSPRYCGGSYGGYGGKSGYSYAVTKLYGSLTSPGVPGSGGGGAHSNYYGTSGGGVIGIQSGTLTLNGTISANGASLLGYHGNGSGGSIHITVNTITGQGTIQANGGNSDNQCGAGGGGRIALYYEDASQFDLNLITAYGGMHGSGTDPLKNAGAGTIYLKKTNDQTQLSKLIIKNRGHDCWGSLIFPVIEPSLITSVSGKVLEDSQADYMPGSLSGMTLIPNINDPGNTYLITANDSTTITVDRDISGAQANDTYKGLMVFNGHLVIDNSFSQIDKEVEMEILTLTGNSVLRHPDCTVDKSTYLFVKAGQVIVENGSRIDVSARGFPGGYQSLLGNSTDIGITLENLPGGGSASWTGGSYGGQGGLYSDHYVGVTYGSLYKPIHAGAGGGAGPNTDHPGGNGGGALRISSPLLELNGSINANGGSIASPKQGAGGAGGSVFLELETISGSGEITANGGSSYYHSAGGGGRIAVYYENMDNFNIDHLHTYGGIRTYQANPATNGGAGTIYLNDTVNHRGVLLVDNNNLDTVYEDRYSTPLPAVGQGSYTLLEAQRLEDSTAQWIPGALTGIKLNPNPIESILFTITGNTGTEIFTDAAEGNMTETPQSGGQYLGELHFFNVTVKGSARVFTTDRIQVSGSLVIEPGSSLKAENHQ